MAKTKPYIYLAGPYTKGDPAINTHCQCLAFDRLLDDGIVTPYAPLWSHFQHGVKPRSYRDWIQYDIDLLESGLFDACLRLDADLPTLGYHVSESTGADGEEQWFRDHGLPCFRSIEKLYFAIDQGNLPITQRTFPRTIQY